MIKDYFLNLYFESTIRNTSSKNENHCLQTRKEKMSVLNVMEPLDQLTKELHVGLVVSIDDPILQQYKNEKSAKIGVDVDSPRAETGNVWGTHKQELIKGIRDIIERFNLKVIMISVTVETNAMHKSYRIIINIADAQPIIDAGIFKFAMHKSTAGAVNTHEFVKP